MADPFSQLYQALTSMFATQANAAPMPVAPAAPAPPVPPSPGAARTAQAANTFDGMNPPAVPTAEAANPATPSPQGQVLARLSVPTAQQPGTIRNGSAGMGQGMVDAINLAKGKSKWGAVAAGLASGIKGQQDADSAAVKQLREMMALQWGLNKDMNAMQEARERNNYMGQYYRSLTAAKENPAERGRVIDPSQRASNITLARQRHMATLVAQGVPQSEIPARMEEFDRQFGFSQPQPQQAPQPDIGPTQDNDRAAWSETPGIMGRTFSRGWVQPKSDPDAAANPAVGNGQPVDMPPAAPAGTPRARPNNAAPQGNPALDRARDAISRGAPREQVIERLRQNGIDPTGL